MKVLLIEYPTKNDWVAFKRRALVTVGKDSNIPPTIEMRQDFLEARHSPIRRLWFGFYLEGIPSWVATHLARHVHAQPYIKSQRTDRTGVDRNKLPQDEPVDMILDVNAEELMAIERGKIADLVFVDDRFNVKNVMLGGRPVKL